MKTAAACTVSQQIIAFVDLVGYHRSICVRLAPDEAFEFLAEYYSVAEEACGGTEARFVKYIGDSILIVFPAESAAPAVTTLRHVKAGVDAWLERVGFDSRVRVKAHVGEVATGPLGGAAFDVCGSTVNETALLPDGEWVLSEDLRRRGEIASLSETPPAT